MSLYTIRNLSPAAPTNLEVESMGVLWIAISWQSHSGNNVVRQEILIERDGELRTFDVSGLEITANITGLKPGIQYVFSVTSESADGQRSMQSNSVTATIPGAALHRN